MNKIYLGIIIIIIVLAVWGSIRYDLIDKGYEKAIGEIKTNTEEEVVETNEKIREIRSHRPSEQRTINRLRNGSF
jgi:Sec-independent protein translocase protein TatA